MKFSVGEQCNLVKFVKAINVELGNSGSSLEENVDACVYKVLVTKLDCLSVVW